MNSARHIALTRVGQGPRIVLLHGFSLTGQAMWPLAQRLPGYEVLCPDLPGHGGTTGFAPDLDGAAELLDAVIGTAPVVLVGWSLGALIGWQRLARDPRLIAGVVSLDMSPRPAPDWPFGMRGPPPEGLASPKAWREAARSLAQGLFAQNRQPDCVADLAVQIAAQDLRAMQRFWAALVGADCRAALVQGKVPLLAIHGAQSRVYPPGTAAWIAASAPKSRAHLLDGAGHAPHLEAPEITADLVANFAKEVLPR